MLSLRRRSLARPFALLALYVAGLSGSLFGQTQVGGSGSPIYYSGSNVGIGTASPASILDVAGTIRATSQTVPTSGTGVEFIYDGSYGRITAVDRGIGAFIPFLLNASVIGLNTAIGEGAGNVGIGTATPPTPLTVSPGSTGSGLGIAWNHMTGGTGETDFYNYAQGGPGGFAFYNYYAPGDVWPSGSPTVLMFISSSGNVGIGTTTPQQLLDVAGTMAAKEIIVSTNGADYVFDPGYRLAPLSEVASYINDHHHLPDIPSAEEVQAKGVSLGDMQSKLLAKIEELTLHMIQAEEENRELRERIGRLEAQGSQTGSH